MLGTFDKDELAELRDAATYIGELPPSVSWEEIRQEIDPNVAARIELTWKWVGKSLDAFFNDASDPLLDSNLPDYLQEVIQSRRNVYLALSVLLFQAEKFLKKEAKALGRNYPFYKRSDLLKRWALEDCCYMVLLSRKNHWESHSGRQHNERARDTRKYFSGEISEERHRGRVERWQQENAKLHRDQLLALSALAQPWISFCMWVFDKYKKQLPALEAYLKATDISQEELIKKCLIINGQLKEYPGRGKNKNKKSKSIS